MTKTASFAGDGCFVIAELSANHNGSLQNALATIEAAAEAGADAIKLQTYSPDTITLDSDRPEFTVQGGAWDGRKLYDLYAEAMTPWEWHEQLFAKAAELNLTCFSSPFDETAVDFLEELNCPIYKIASFEATHLPLIERIAATGRPIIMSIGNATLHEAAQAVATIRGVWGDRDIPLGILKCVSAYPAAPENMNLRTIPHIASTFDCIAGLSDHSPGAAVAVCGVALGARILEKHLILDRNMGGPDSHFSMEPAEFRSMVEQVRIAEAAIGDVTYGPSSDRERANLAFRRSVYVSRDVSAGELISADNVRVVRPAFGLPPSLYHQVLGARASRDLIAGHPLSLADLRFADGESR